MRLIDADELKKELSKRLWFVSSPEHDAQEIMDIIDNAPTINKVEPNDDKTCKTCLYYFIRSTEYPCARCRRNNALIDEIREQQNDRWKDGTQK